MTVQNVASLDFRFVLGWGPTFCLDEMHPRDARPIDHSPRRLVVSLLEQSIINAPRSGTRVTSKIFRACARIMSQSQPNRCSGTYLPLGDLQLPTPKNTMMMLVTALYNIIRTQHKMYIVQRIHGIGDQGHGIVVYPTTPVLHYRS